MYAFAYTITRGLAKKRGPSSVVNIVLQTLTIPDGFGARLREERERLGLSQAALASAAGVRRLAQGQYEKEHSSPSVRYLAAVAAAGVDLQYALFGRRRGGESLSPAEIQGIESRAFELLEEFVHKQAGMSYGAESRFALFQLIRSNLIEQTRASGQVAIAA